MSSPSIHTYQQVQGTAMGTKMAPSYANLFMDSLETCFLKDEPLQPALWRRYIDDIFCVWTGSRKSLEAFLHRLNSCHPTIHFTWTISTEGIVFLDIRIYVGSTSIKPELRTLRSEITTQGAEAWTGTCALTDAGGETEAYLETKSTKH